MQIVIDIPDIEIPTERAMDTIILFFENGHVCKCNYPFKELPKGHGRLIDADSIYQIVRPIEQSDAEWGMTAETAIRLMHDVFDKAPTVIEADKESEEQ